MTPRSRLWGGGGFIDNQWRQRALILLIHYIHCTTAALARGRRLVHIGWVLANERVCGCQVFKVYLSQYNLFEVTISRLEATLHRPELNIT
jgi:hypothetical protein